ncbi:L-threonylcarbamoyladenylate synthase [Paenibacillus sp. WLX1005]|uniref:L-threonylcarbamoyladenylate synthase n=1 Tax=Paenibacillus sp. WLX1005 TaxID=3243766 RepID=UPI00398457DF
MSHEAESVSQSNQQASGKTQPQVCTIWQLTQHTSQPEQLAEAGAVLAQGGIVAFPTETVYGLGADAGNTSAVEAVFAAKGRPADNPLIVHISQNHQLDELVQRVLPLERQLMDAFWPGPLTLVMPVVEDVLSPRVTAGLRTVGIRMPDHPVALALITASGKPLAAPSANRSGRPSPTTAAHVADDLADRIDGIVDGGDAGVGVESTVIQVKENGTVLILRPGGITREQLLTIATDVQLDPGLAGVSAEIAPLAPGMKYTHYAPRGNMSIVIGHSPAHVGAWMQQQLLAAQQRGEQVGVLTFDEDTTDYGSALRLSLGSAEQPEQAASRLYGSLRTFDDHNITYILAQGCSESGVGLAVMNRLSKAAGGQIITID